MFHKQVVRELKGRYQLDGRTIKKYLERYTPPQKQHQPRAINVVVDATYFGERRKHTNWCVVVFRDPKKKENLWWRMCETETTSVYREGKDYLTSLGYSIQSVTGDGFGGIRTAFSGVPSGVPYQMCHVHMERLVIRGTTRNPKTEAGEVLLALVRTLHVTTASVFHMRLLQYVQKYQTFLNDKTFHPLSGDSSWTHQPLRQAVHSLLRFQPFLFTFQKYPSLPKTTNSLEGHFSHIKDIVRIHRGISQPLLEKMLHSILLASSIAPSVAQLTKYL